MPATIKKSEVTESPVMSYNMTRVRRYLVEKKDMDEAMVDRMMAEYRRFIEIRLNFPEVSIVPSELVDEVWHTHILFSKDYFRFCDVVNHGEYIHHNPFLSGDNLIGDPSIRNTLTYYRQLYGKPDQEIWPTSSAAGCETASCGKCSSEDCGPRCS